MKRSLCICILLTLFTASPLTALQRISEYGVYVTLDTSDQQRETNRFIRILDIRAARAVTSAITSHKKRAVHLTVDKTIEKPELSFSKRGWKLKGKVPADFGRGHNKFTNAYIVAKHLCAIRMRRLPAEIPDWIAAGAALQAIHELDSRNRIGQMKYPAIRALLDNNIFVDMQTITIQAPPLSSRAGFEAYTEYSSLILSTFQSKQMWRQRFISQLKSSRKLTHASLTTIIGNRRVNEPLSFGFHSDDPLQHWFSSACFNQVYSIRSPLPPVRTIRLLLQAIEDLETHKPLSPLFSSTLETFFKKLEERKPKISGKAESDKKKQEAYIDRKQHVIKWLERIDRLYILSNPYMRDSLSALTKECRQLIKNDSYDNFVKKYNAVFLMQKKWNDIEELLNKESAKREGLYAIPQINEIISSQPKWQALEDYLDTLE